MTIRAARALWIKRGLIAMVSGAGVGLGIALIVLKMWSTDAPLPPLVPIADDEAPAEQRRTISGPRADGMRPNSAEKGLVGGGEIASRSNVAVVPDINGRVEGDARRLLERAGFIVGSILFREADEPVGTVLESYPVSGERVQLPATVNLILADRRRTIDIPDTLGRIDLPDSLRSIELPDSLR